MIGAKAGVLVEVAPGGQIIVTDSDPLHHHAVMELVPLGGATYRAVARPVVEWVELSTASLRRLGITLSKATLHRLGRAGFIRTRQISPSRFQFNYQSWAAHCEHCNEPEFWEQESGTGTTAADRRKSNRAKYLEAL